jgi:phenolic acid decarboxylase
MDEFTRTLQYLNGCLGKGLLYTYQGTLEAECYIDVDWVGSLDDQCFTSGYCAFVGGRRA